MRRESLSNSPAPSAEPYRLADVSRPILRASRFLGRNPLTGDVRDVGNLRRSLSGSVRSKIGEWRHHRIHHRGMKGMRSVERLGGNAPRGHLLLEFRHRLVRTGNDAQVGRIDCCDGELAIQATAESPAREVVPPAWTPAPAPVRVPRAAPPASALPPTRKHPPGTQPRIRPHCAQSSPRVSLPQAIHNCARAYSIVNSAGCVKRVWRSCSFAALFITAWSEKDIAKVRP